MLVHPFKLVKNVKHGHFFSAGKKVSKSQVQKLFTEKL